jgi:hypothetical protein
LADTAAKKIIPKKIRIASAQYAVAMLIHDLSTKNAIGGDIGHAVTPPSYSAAASPNR